MKSRIWIAAGMVTFLIGCSTAHKRAETLMDGKAYDEAAGVYEGLLKDDPNDAKAIVGLRAAREYQVNNKLIEVRMVRLAGNTQEALDKLLEIVQMEDSAKYVPKGNVAFTQSEEVSYAFPLFELKVKRALKAHHPLLAESLVLHYKEVFDGNLKGRKFKELAEKTSIDGRNSCREFQSYSSATYPYFADFTKRYCSHWGEAIRNPAAELVTLRLQNHFGTLKLNGDVKNLPREVSQEFERELRSGLEETAWFDADAKDSLTIHVQGQFQKASHSEVINQVQQYTVQVPYTDYVPQMQTRQVPYTATEYQCQYVYAGAASRNVCGNVQVTEYRQEYYTITVPVTRYRTVPKAYAYNATKYYQSLILLITGKANVKGHDVSLTLTEKSEDSDIGHDIEMPDIGLRPKTASLPDPLSWVKDQAGKLKSQFQERVASLWQNLYCKPSQGARNVASVGNSVQRCLKGSNDAIPTFVEDWYEKYLGVSYEDGNQVLGK